jgi:hypothetical protein
MTTRAILLTLLLSLLAPLAMASDRRDARQVDKMREKLQLRIPKVSFENARIEDVIAYLRAESKRLDPDGEGVSIVYIKRPAKVRQQKPAQQQPVDTFDWAE